MKYFITILLSLIGVCLHAEEKKDSIIGYANFCCIYNHTIKTIDLNNKEVTDTAVTILEVGDDVAKYEDYFEYFYSAEFTIPNYFPNYMEGDSRSYDNATIYQNYPQYGNIIGREGLLPNFYVYNEQPALNWVLIKGREKVIGYDCKKALVQYAGRKWFAYYTEDIPSANGPWKLTGLPGLVLKAESEDGVHSFIAQHIYKVEKPKIIFEKNKTDVSVSRDKFIKLRNQIKTDDRWAKNAAYYIGKDDIKKVVHIHENNVYGMAPKYEINNISIPLSGGFEHRFQPLELK